MPTVLCLTKGTFTYFDTTEQATVYANAMWGDVLYSFDELSNTAKTRARADAKLVSYEKVYRMPVGADVDKFLCSKRYLFAADGLLEFYSGGKR